MIHGVSLPARSRVRRSMRAAFVTVALALSSVAFLGAAHASVGDDPSDSGSETANGDVLEQGGLDPLDPNAGLDAGDVAGTADRTAEDAGEDAAPTTDPNGEDGDAQSGAEDGNEYEADSGGREFSLMSDGGIQLLQDDTGCFYANEGSGAYAQSLCWFDFTGFTTQYQDRGVFQNPRWVSVLDPTNGPFNYTVVGSQSSSGTTRYGRVQNYPIEISLGGGYTLTAKIDTNASNNNALAITSHKFPTWTGAFLGNTHGNIPFYTGVGGQPALYQALDAGGGTSNLTLKDIKLTGPSGVVQDYSIVVADAESTDAGEQITWSTTGAGFAWLPNNPAGPLNQTNVMGNACSQSYTPALNGTGTSASCLANTSPTKNGTAMLATKPPANPNTSFSVTQNMKGNGKEGVAFGVIFARAETTVVVKDRVLTQNNLPSTENFNASAKIASETEPLFTAETGTAELNATKAQGLPVSAAGTQLAFNSAASGTHNASYMASWVCTKTVPQQTEPLRWPASGSSSAPPPAGDPFTLIKVGEYIGCTVTYTPPYLQLKKVVSNEGSYAPVPLPTPQNWNLAATGDPAVGLPTVTAAGDTVRTPVPIGDYALSETPGTGFLEDPGFELDGWSCPDAAFSDTQVTIQKGDDVVCTATNKSLPGSAIWSKIANGAPTETLLGGAEWSLTGPGVPANTTVTDCVEAGQCGTSAFADQDPEPGKFQLENLRWGTYTLTETRAPAGYRVDSTVRTFTVGKDGTTFDLDADWGVIENTQQTVPALPVSGGIGTDQIYIATAALLALAGGAYTVKRTKMRQLARKAGAATE